MMNETSKVIYDTPQGVRDLIEFEQQYAPDQRMRIGYTSGAFEVLDDGNKEFLRAASCACDFLVVSVHGNPFVYQTGHMPTYQEDRALAVASLDFVKAVHYTTTKPFHEDLGIVPTDEGLTAIQPDRVFYEGTGQHDNGRDLLRHSQSTSAMFLEIGNMKTIDGFEEPRRRLVIADALKGTPALEQP